MVLPPRLDRALRILLGSRFQDVQREWRRLLRRTHPRERRRYALQGDFVRRHGPLVSSGPFRGMVYVAEAVGLVPNLVPRLVGAYEVELHGAIEEAAAAGYERIVNVGSADGYYAVGLARRLPEAHVFAFDTDQAEIALCRLNAAANGVADRLVFDRHCTPGWVAALPPARTLFVVDCEGCELGLLDPAVAPPLAEATLIVELHDFMHPRASELLLTRFAATHDARIVASCERDPRRYPPLRYLGADDARALLSEGRPPGMGWAILVPRGD